MNAKHTNTQTHKHTFTYSVTEVQVGDGISGIVCGINNSSSSITCYEDVSTFRFFTIPNAIYSVRTEGKINASSALSSTHWGGMVGDNQGSVVHSTAKVIVGNGSQNNGGAEACSRGGGRDDDDTEY